MNWFDYFLIQQSGYFDPAYYLLEYSDCRQADVDPLTHFVRHGWRERRNPSGRFHTGYYLNSNPDVLNAGMNPLVHYIRYGRQEGRRPHPDYSDAGLLSRSGEKRAGSAGVKSLRNLIYRLGKKVYWSMPPGFRQKVLTGAYQRLGFLFRGMGHYENWRIAQIYAPSAEFSLSRLIALNQVRPAENLTGSAAVHLHIFYHDLAREFARYFDRIPFPFDLFVSVSNNEDLETYKQLFKGVKNVNAVRVERVVNRGRDIAPFIATFGSELAAYDIVAHFHTKKSLYNNGSTLGWREYLCENLLGSEERVRKIFSLLQDAPAYGIVYPQNYYFLPAWANTWLANKGLGRVWCARLGIKDFPEGYFDYPASSMFWARSKAILPILTSGVGYEDFAEEAGQTDGTLAHCFERLFALCANSRGYPPAILADEKNPSWSAWRFDQYMNRSLPEAASTFSQTKARLIAFDMFDTLVCRPLLSPESIKELVARRTGEKAGSAFKQYRSLAEQEARSQLGRDVDLDQIYARFTALSGLSSEEVENLRAIEEDIEEQCLQPRRDAAAIYQAAIASGKTVLVISDMFLSSQFLAAQLNKFGIQGWDGFFVSSETGARKDNGLLFEHVLKQYGAEPADLLMIGDNERSDIQIPCDMGASFYHLLRPVELARGIPRFRQIVEQHLRAKDVDAELTLGLVVRKNFAPVFIQGFTPDALIQVDPYLWGYSLVGPMLTSFAEWLLQKAQADGIERLYFLSREGKIIQQVFDAWGQNRTGTPTSTYLVLSRRAASVATADSFEALLQIARTIYYPNTLASFLYTRYGVEFSPEKWGQIAAATGLTAASIIRVDDQKIEHLIPLMEYIQDELNANAAREKSTMLEYLASIGMGNNDSQAVVDIGYGGTIQGYLNRIVAHKVHGYYLMTENRSLKVAQQHQVNIQGCFFENLQSSSNVPTMMMYSFEVEKLLSSNDPQIEYYETLESGEIQGHFRPLAVEEKQAVLIRDQIQKGAMDYVHDARFVRQNILPDYQPSCATARMLLDAFLADTSPEEKNLLAKIVLDDFYCGRGLVT